jgi:hypothetical protein
MGILLRTLTAARGPSRHCEVGRFRSYSGLPVKIKRSRMTHSGLYGPSRLVLSVFELRQCDSVRLPKSIQLNVRKLYYARPLFGIDRDEISKGAR